MSSYDFDVIGIIAKTDFLPPYFAIAQKALRLMSKEDIQFRELAAVFETDQALVSKLLGLVNSTFYGLPRQITRIPDALSYLGLEETRNLIWAVCTKEAFSSRSDHNTWHHSLSTAYLAEALAKYSRKGVDQSQAFTAGLVHDIGIAFIDKKIPEASEEILLKIDLGRSRLEAEQSVLGMDHAIIGGIILRQWSVPQIIIEAVQYHHFPWEVNNPLCPIIALANQVSNQSQAKTITVEPRLLEYSSITQEDLRTLNSATQVTISNFENKISGS
jgi:putative nucleotidyltransferase with HDIG domain